MDDPIPGRAIGQQRLNEFRLAAWNILNHVATVRAIKAILVFELGDQLAFWVFHRDRPALSIGDRLSVSVEVRHRDESLINRLDGGGPGDPAGRW